MAWLTRLIHIAVEADHASPGAAQNLRMRYTLPAYQTVRGAAKRAVIAKLFNEARAVADELGDRLIAPEGVPIDVALKVAAAARETTTSANIIEGGAYEAVAAAVCHASSAGGAQHLLVFDIGAGTTDIAALRLSASGWVAGEVQEARRSLPLGGDNFDRLMLNTFVERARAVKSVEAQARLWRRAALSARAAKEQLFAEGRAAFVFEGKTVVAKAADVFKDAEFKTLMNELSDAYAESLNAVALDAERSGEKEIAVVLAGGGANLPFIQEMLRKAKPPKNKIRVRVLPIVPAWAHDPVFGGNLAPIFSQLSIAIGGAMASTELLSAMS